MSTDSLYRSDVGAQRVAAGYEELLRRWPAPNRQRRVPTSAGETFVIECGNPNGPPLLLLHGSGGNSAMWIADCDVWAEHLRIFAVDLIGEPGRSAPTRLPLGSDAHARWLDEVLAGLSLTRVALVGTSLGGWLALDYALRRPHRVERLVLMAPGGIGRQRTSFLFKMLPLLLFGAWGRRKALRIAAGPAPDRPSEEQQLYAELLGLIQQEFRRRMATLPPFGDDALHGLRVPLLLIVGDRDAVFDSADTARRLTHSMPAACVVHVAGAGHAVFGQSTAILEFLRSPAPG